MVRNRHGAIEVHAHSGGFRSRSGRDAGLPGRPGKPGRSIGGQLAREALELCVDSENEALALAAEDALDELNLFDGSFDLFDFDEDDFDDFFELDDDLNGHNGHNNRDYLH